MAAINEAGRPVTPAEITRYLSSRIHPAPTRDDVTAAVHILELPSVTYRRGEASGIVLARVLDALEAATTGKEYPASSGGVPPSGGSGFGAGRRCHECSDAPATVPVPRDHLATL
ncbi:hypothetical protein [Nocardia amamiensis]|uniref:hypothetical protein n=1 Tax=Nocardia amamiensis TaxID=404578 RepID=UPI00082F458F|nr:hypothetical protein [Nocardia amamiensis]